MLFPVVVGMVRGKPDWLAQRQELGVLQVVLAWLKHLVQKKSLRR
jgi:hypothetical protein